MKRALALAAAAVALALAACDSDGDAPERAPTAAGDRCDPNLDRSLRAWAGAGFSGSIAVSSRGEFDCLAGYGLADTAAKRSNTIDTVFSIGSVSKAFAAAAVADLVGAGKLSLSDRAGDLLPGLEGPVARATVAQLLLHTSGLTGSHGRDHRPLSRDEAIAAIGELEQAFEPGSDFLYSNAGYTLLALIVEEVSGMSYRTYVASRILRLPGGTVAGGFWDGEPAARGPRAVGYLEEGPTEEMGDFGGPHWALAGSGDLAMTMRGLAAWTHALFTGRIVSPDAVDILTRPGFAHGNGQSETPGWVAHDESVHGVPFLATAGGGGDVGHNAVVAWIPEGEQVVAIASSGPGVTAEELLEAIGPALLAGDPLPAPRAPSGAVDPSVLAAIAGTYQLESGGSFEVAARDGRLAITASGPKALAAVFPLPSDFTTSDARAHERRVSALLAGETSEGRQERRLFEADFGPIENVEITGTIAREGELRTYVTIRSGKEAVLTWFAVDERGGIAAASVPADPPKLEFVPAGRHRYRPDDPTASGPELTVEFDRGWMTVTGPAGEARARLEGPGR
jgi:CubicO group peptidase (beta-lactamase class C family)